MTRLLRHGLPLALLLSIVPGRDARAGLRPIYGGELLISAPGEPQAKDPAQAWSAVEVLLANALGTSLDDLLEEPPTLSGASLHMSVRADATWPDGTPVEARSLAHLLRNALTQAPVALPPFSFRANGKELIAELTTPLAEQERYLTVPWLRVTRGADGPFHPDRSGYAMTPNTFAGRPFVDRLRVDVHEGKRVDPHADGLALSQAGEDGRPVFALVRPASAAADALRGALATLDRPSIAKFFVRSAAYVPDGWPVPAATPANGTSSTVVVLVDGSEPDLRTVAERLQILLRNQHVAARIASESRNTFLSRLSSGNYDLALVALPRGPPLVQAATLVRYAEGREAADRFWARPDVSASPFDAAAVLKSVAGSAGAMLLYVEGGKTVLGAHLRGTAAPVWELNPADIWLMPSGSP